MPLPVFDLEGRTSHLAVAISKEFPVVELEAHRFDQLFDLFWRSTYIYIPRPPRLIFTPGLVVITLCSAFDTFVKPGPLRDANGLRFLSGVKSQLQRSFVSARHLFSREPPAYERFP